MMGWEKMIVKKNSHGLYIYLTGVNALIAGLLVFVALKDSKFNSEEG
jgi:hypothetical protein